MSSCPRAIGPAQKSPVLQPLQLAYILNPTEGGNSQVDERPAQDINNRNRNMTMELIESSTVPQSYQQHSSSYFQRGGRSSVSLPRPPRIIAPVLRTPPHTRMDGSNNPGTAFTGRGLVVNAANPQVSGPNTALSAFSSFMQSASVPASQSPYFGIPTIPLTIDLKSGSKNQAKKRKANCAASRRYRDQRKARERYKEIMDTPSVTQVQRHRRRKSTQLQTRSKSWDQILCVFGVFATIVCYGFDKSADSILSQKKWMPRIGDHSYTPETQFQYQPPTDLSWDDACVLFTKSCAGIMLTQAQLREQLNALLRRLECIPDHSDHRGLGFTLNQNFVLLCQSLNIAVPAKLILSDRHVDYHHMANILNRCAPFLKQSVAASTVKSWVECFREIMDST